MTATNAAEYAAAEERLLDACGLTPQDVTDHEVTLPNLGSRVRVREIGEGVPTLFIHGGPNSGGTWTPLAARLSGLRCLLLDRPGTGLSEPLPRPLDLHDLDAYATTLASDVLDAMGIDRAHVVASSFGGMVALRSAAAHPERFDRMVQMACPAFAPGMRTPPFMRGILSPILRPIIGALPPNDRAGKQILRQIGHGKSIDAGRIPQMFFDWYLDLQRHTDTMANEMAMIGGGGGFFRGFDPSLEMTRDQLAAVTTPTYFLWGSDDTFGAEDVARALVAAMPNAELEMLPDAGHLPWLDDLDHAAEVVQRFLTA